MEIPDKIRHCISLNFIYSDKRGTCRNKLFSFMWVSLYCASEGFNLSIWSNVVCNLKRNQKKNKISRVELFINASSQSCPKDHADVWAAQVLCKLCSNHTTKKLWTLSSGGETNRERARSTAQVLKRPTWTQTAPSKLFYQQTSGKTVLSAAHFVKC